MSLCLISCPCYEDEPTSNYDRACPRRHGGIEAEGRKKGPLAGCLHTPHYYQSCLPDIEGILNRERRSGMSLETLFDTVLPLSGAVLCSLPSVIFLAVMAGLAIGFVICLAGEGGAQ